MSEEVRRVLDPLSPPSGGLVRLRTRIARDEVRRVSGRRVRVGLGALVVAVGVGWAALNRGSDPVAASPELDLARMSLGLLPAPTEPLTLPEAARATTAVLRVSLPTDQVVFYVMASFQPSGAAAP